MGFLLIISNNSALAATIEENFNAMSFSISSLFFKVKLIFNYFKAYSAGIDGRLD